MSLKSLLNNEIITTTKSIQIIIYAQILICKNIKFS